MAINSATGFGVDVETDSALTDVNDKAFIPQGRKGFLGSQGDGDIDSRLPNYRKDGWYVSLPQTLLTLEECNDVLQTMIHRTRLIIFELALQQTPFSVFRGRRYIRLVGPARELDEQLHSWSVRVKGDLNIHYEIEDGKKYESPNLITTDVFVRLVESQPAFLQSEAKSKSKIQRIQKQFSQNVTEPLKQRLINKKKVIDYGRLVKFTDKLEISLKETVETHRRTVEKIIKDIGRNSPVWAEVVRLGKQIDELFDKARAQGWDADEHDFSSDDEDDRNDAAYREYKRLNAAFAFDTGDGPQKVITYLERWLAEHPKSPPIQQNARISKDVPGLPADNVETDSSPDPSHQDRHHGSLPTLTLTTSGSANSNSSAPGGDKHESMSDTGTKSSSAHGQPPIDMKNHSRKSSTASKLKQFFRARKGDSSQA